MFGSNKEEKNVSNNRVGSSSLNVNLLSAGTVFEGKVSSDSDIRIDGKFNGDLTCKSKIIIGASGEFEGNIDCRQAVIEGKFKGYIKVQELLEVKDSGKLSGDVETSKLIVESGAIFDVSCSMGGESSGVNRSKISTPTISKVAPVAK